MTHRTIALLTLLTLNIGAMQTATAAIDQSDAKHWHFDVLLDDKPIGTHTFDVQESADGVVLETEASFDVKFLFFNAFRYRHQTTEIWADGCLDSIDAMTSSNGNLLEVRGRRAADGFAVVDTDGSSALPGCVQSFAYWNPDILKSEQLLNSQTGDYEAITVTYEGPDQVIVGEHDIAAYRYTLAAKGGDITLWYSTDSRVWLGLEAPARGGRILKYRPVATPRSVPQLAGGS